MNPPLRTPSLCALLLCLNLGLTEPSPGEITRQPWISEGKDAHLIYGTNNLGDRIPDFSNAGYGGGGVKIPDVPVVKKLNPSTNDDSAAIQEAVNAVGAMPLKDGFRGTVLLSPGTFHCSNTITLSQSGVVLRGSGTSTNNNSGSVIEMTGDGHVCIAIQGMKLEPPVDAGQPVPITDAYIPCGTESLSVKDASSFHEGDLVVIRRPVTKEWLHRMEMDTLVRNGKPQTWIRVNSPIFFERTIVSVEGNKIRIDLPITEGIDTSLLPPDAAVVCKVTHAGGPRLTQCGVESLAIVSPPPHGDLRAKNNQSIKIRDAEDCWVREVAMYDTLGNVSADASRRITIEGAHALHTRTVEKGAGGSCDFFLLGSQILMNRCSSISPGSFFVSTMRSSSRLNVVLNSTFTGPGTIHPHARWSTALLTDSCQLPEGSMSYINRGTCGSGHGWSMGWGVVWNTMAKKFDIQQPPGCINWCIGCTGEMKEKKMKKGGVPPTLPSGPWLESFGTPVLPKSLYLAQLRERLGDQALHNIGY